MRVLMPLPRRDYDPTEAGVAHAAIRAAGHEVVFATPDGHPAQADPLMLSGEGFDAWGRVPGLRRLKLVGLFLRADARGRAAHAAMVADPACARPLRHQQLDAADFDALLLPGGHAQGMREYLESTALQRVVADFFVARKPVGAICHGVGLARISHTGRGSSRRALRRGRGGRRRTGDSIATTSNEAIGAKNERGPRSERMQATDCIRSIRSENQHRREGTCILSRRCEKCGLAARAQRGGRSVLHGLRTTALTWAFERKAWMTTRWGGRWWDRDYYRTYLEAPGEAAGWRSVQAEVTRALARPEDFLDVPADDPERRRKTGGLARDTPDDARPAFVVVDDHYVSARWPGDAHTFARRFVELLHAARRSQVAKP